MRMCLAIFSSKHYLFLTTPIYSIYCVRILSSLVSCPNYTYEVGSWLAFAVMTQCIPAFLFAAAGFYQMAVWALGKHKNYRSEFKNYPKNRKAIVPFVL